MAASFTSSTILPTSTPLQAFENVSRISRRNIALRQSKNLDQLRRRSSRRKVQLVLLLTTALLLAMRTRMPREVWSFPRSSAWWDEVVCKTFTHRDWVENFRVSQETFFYICTEVHSEIERQNTRFRKAVSVQKRVAITLWVLATQCEYWSVGHLFGLARCTVCRIVHETCRTIVKVLLPKYIRFPVGESLAETVKGFLDNWGIPQCVGAIDGSHIPVRPPSMNHTDYYNRKGWYSVLVQAVVDANYLFTDLNVGWPGSVHDARVLSNSELYRKCINHEYLQGDGLQINNSTIPLFLIGDSAYPLLSWLIKPFPTTSLITEEQKKYNYRICRGRVVVEIAFGRLKARWRRLLKQNDMFVENVPCVVAACCVLHNICEIHGDDFDEDWIEPDPNQPAAPADGNTAGRFKMAACT